MRPDTVIHMAVNSVGGSDDPTVVFKGNFGECVIELAKWIGRRSIKKRIEIIIARSEEEARDGLRIKRSGRALGGELGESDQAIMDEVARFIEEANKETANG
jgi:hypothetical protein